MKRIICTILCLCMFTSLWGCAGNVPNPTGGSTVPSSGGDPTDGSTDPSGLDPTTPPETTLSQYQDPNATHLYEEVREGFLVDAEVVGSAGNIPRECYYAKPLWFDQDQMEAFLKVNGDTLVSGETETNAYYIEYSGVCGSGSTIFFQRDHNHPGTNFVYRNWEEYHYYNEYFVIPYITIDDTFQYSTARFFMDKKDFSFATAEQAEQEVRQALSALGLSEELTLYLTLYVDHEAMAQVGQMLATDEEYAPIGESRPNNGFDLKEDWSEADDAYAFVFTFDMNGIPLSHRSEHRETATYTGCAVQVCYTASGIVYLAIDSPWTVLEPVGDPVTLVTAGAAVETVKQKLVNVLTYQDQIIEQAYLEYQYRQDGSRWQLVPVWVVTSSYKGWDGGRQYVYNTVDAVTGQEI